MTSMMRSMGTALFLALWMGACATAPEIEPREIQRAEAAIQEARDVEAGRYAASILAQSQERLSLAREAIDEGDPEQARRLLEQTVALADHAEAQSLAEQSQAALDQIEEQMAVLRQRIE